MFSYISNKSTSNTLENTLIRQIYSIANDIFDSHQSSQTRTDQQELSLELSSATDQDCHSIEDNKFRLGKIRQIGSILNQRNTKQQAFQSITQRQDSGKDFANRLTRSMISGNADFAEPGSFSHKYNQNKNESASIVNLMTKKLDKQKSVGQSFSVLNPSNLNKSNILTGIMQQKSKSKKSKKTPKKIGKFSSSYISNYLSPCSVKNIKQNRKSYMQKSNLRLKKFKQTTEFQYIKRRINEHLQPQISYRKQKSSRNKLKIQKFNNIKSKYREVRPLMSEYKLYANQNIHKKMKQQMKIWQDKKRRYQTLSNKEIQQNWCEFITKEKQFLEDKKKNIMSKKFQSLYQQQKKCKESNKKHEYDRTEPKMSAEDYIKKYKREKEKLKQKLQQNEISNYLHKSFDFYTNSDHPKIQYKSYITDKKQTRQILLQQENEGKINLDTGLISQFLIENNEKGFNHRHQNFFISVGEKSKSKSRSKHKNVSNFDNHILAKSTFYQSKPISIENKISKFTAKSAKFCDPATLISGKKRLSSNILSPFIKKSHNFSRQSQDFNVKQFDSKKHNSPLFNDQNYEKRSKQQLNLNNQISKFNELIKPKYIKSINQFEQYYSHHQLKQNLKKKTFKTCKILIQQKNIIKQKNKNYNQFRRSPQRKNSKQSKILFDSKLMNKIIQDLDQISCQIQQNKKKRKFKIQNYRNISNLKKQSNSNLKYQFQPQFLSLFQIQNATKHNHHNILQKNNNQLKQSQQNLRKNHHLKKTQQYSTNIMKKFPKVIDSRSISPIQREECIMLNKDTLSSSMMIVPQENLESQIKKLEWSQLNNKMGKNSMIIVKSREQIEFALTRQNQ